MDHPEGVSRPAAGARRLGFTGTEGAVRRSREFSREAMWSWRWLPTADTEQRAVSEDVLLMVAELVGNACLHAPGGPRELRLDWDGSRLRVEVLDDSPVSPRLRRGAGPGSPAGPGPPGGHGLRVVDRLARAWGCEPEGGGKRVWLEVPSPLPPARHARRPA
ncbi:ATP-binding protein [Kitasatospora sp. NPDC056446]|uniref:ATP-binding protein n=1 Tax=Kitasatospora sp. NPDC056446 TaxID=3345819 RepID=UPI0036A066E7